MATECACMYIALGSFMSVYVPKHLGDSCIQNFYLGRCIVGYTVGNLVFTATRERSRKT